MLQVREHEEEDITVPIRIVAVEENMKQRTELRVESKLSATVYDLK